MANTLSRICFTHQEWPQYNDQVLNHNSSLRKQMTFRNANNGFLTKWCLRNERRNSILIMCHYPDLGSASDWLKQISQAAWLIRSSTQLWVVTHHQYAISVLFSQMSLRGEIVVKCCLFSHPTIMITDKNTCLIVNVSQETANSTC